MTIELKFESTTGAHALFEALANAGTALLLGPQPNAVLAPWLRHCDDASLADFAAGTAAWGCLDREAQARGCSTGRAARQGLGQRKAAPSALS